MSELETAVPAARRASSSSSPRSMRAGGGLLAARIGVLAALVAIWYVVARLGWVSPTVLSPPGTVFAWLGNAFADVQFWSDLAATMLATVIAWVLATAAGVVVGIVLALLPRLERVVDPFLSALNAMPRIALAPVFVVAFGLTINAKIALAFSLVLFISISAARAGVASVDLDHTRLAEVLGASKVQKFTKILLPVAVPAIFGGIRLGLVYALLGTVTAELIGSTDGIGQELQTAAGQFQIEAMYGLLIVLAVIASLINAAMGALERRILQWQP
ncbi:ABC transporter permease [Amycolatopsis sp. NPDC005232]|uniref:ABC transporter permease n=1 Tax=Amycolatopsis sp. NPDC005232 TaxID=3157027 RepID=UPI00339DF772